MQVNREVLVSRRYQKGPDWLALFVARLSGGEISGVEFQFEHWFNDEEKVRDRVTSGNKYYIRKAFLNGLLDALEDDWKLANAGSGGSEDHKFFDPQLL